MKLAQGRENVLVHLKANPDTAARITTAVQQKLQEVGSRGTLSSKKASTSSSLDDVDFEDDLLDDDALFEELERRQSGLNE